MALDSAKRTISGTWGEVWLDEDYVSECYGLTAKMTFNKEEIGLCRQMARDAKVTSTKGTGSIKLYKTSSRMALKIGEAIRDGRDIRFTIISKLADPDAYGSERVRLKNVSFDELSLAEWEVGNVGRSETPFTFTDYEFLDSIEPKE